MTGPPPAVAELRVAVRAALAAREPDYRMGGRVLVACSGGPDSVALAAAAAFVGPRMRISVGLITVDHGLQDGSRERAEQVVTWARGLGLEPAVVVTVEVSEDGTGPEAAARAARYEALIAAAKRHGASSILLGHTMEDQAETCLLSLARGAGPRGMSGMPERREVDGVWLLRPLLGINRATTRKAAAETGFTPWEDPHNADRRFARPRVRHELLPALIDALGQGVVGNLAQTARMLATDASYLDDLAVIARRDAAAGRDAGGELAGGDAAAGRGVGGELVGGDAAATGRYAAAAGRDGARAGDAVEPELRVDVLAGLHPAIRSRVLHRFALDLGAAPAALGHRHVDALDALVTRWHGQGPVWLPGGVAVARVEGRLVSGDGRIPP